MVDRLKASEPASGDDMAVSREEMAVSYAGLRAGLLRYLRGRVEDAATAEDLLHTVFLKALATDQSVKSSDAIASWLYQIARNALIDYYRARRPVSALPDELALEAIEDTSSVQALSACLLPLAQQLPSLYRDVLVATEFQGKTKHAVATDLGLSVSAVKSRASRGRRMLKDKLLACCHVELSPSGAITDHHSHTKGSCKLSC